MAWTGSKWRVVLLDFLERAGWSAGEVFFATLLAGGTAAAAANFPWKYSLSLAIGAAVSSIVLTALQYLGRITDLPFWPDLLVRLIKTFLGSLAAAFAAGVFDITTFHWSTAMNVAALATLSALGKGLLARQQQTPAAPDTNGRPAATRPSPSTLTAHTYAAAVRKQPAVPR
jgi:hypothetical protein